jgi:hypothetical protein
MSMQLKEILICDSCGKEIIGNRFNSNSKLDFCSEECENKHYFTPFAERIRKLKDLDIPGVLFPISYQITRISFPCYMEYLSSQKNEGNNYSFVNYVSYTGRGHNNCTDTRCQCKEHGRE